MKRFASIITGLLPLLVLVMQYEAKTNLAARYKADPASIHQVVRARHTSIVNYVPKTNDVAVERNLSAITQYVGTVDRAN